MWFRGKPPLVGAGVRVPRSLIRATGKLPFRISPVSALKSAQPEDPLALAAKHKKLALTMLEVKLRSAHEPVSHKGPVVGMCVKETLIGLEPDREDAD